MPHPNGPSSGPAILLVDADNLSSPESVERALQMLIERVGPVAVRRAYGSPDNLKGLGNVMRELAIRPCVNLPLTKNTTDMALAVDAMDLCQQLAPAVVAIGTGDADFAPLVLRLRERGVRTICFSQGNKMSPEVHGFYDEVVLIGPRAARRGAALAPAPRQPSARRLPAAPAMAPRFDDEDMDDDFAAPLRDEAPMPLPVAKPARKRAAAKKAVAKPVAAAPTPRAQPVAAPRAPSASAPRASSGASSGVNDAAVRQQVRELLEDVPGLTDGRHVEFGDVVKQLRDAKLLSKSANASRFLKKHAPYIVLTPEKQPNKLHWVAAAL